MSDELRWSRPFFEHVEVAMGWFWYLRMPDHKCIAQASKHYDTLEESIASTEIVKMAVEAAAGKQPLIGYRAGGEEKKK